MRRKDNIYAAQMLEDEARELEAQAVELRQKAKLIRVSVRQERMHEYGRPTPATMDGWDGLRLHIEHNRDPYYKESKFILPEYGLVLCQQGIATQAIVTWDAQVAFLMEGVELPKRVFAHGRRELREHLSMIKPIHDSSGDGQAKPINEAAQVVHFAHFTQANNRGSGRDGGS